MRRLAIGYQMTFNDHHTTFSSRRVESPTLHFESARASRRSVRVNELNLRHHGVILTWYSHVQMCFLRLLRGKAEFKNKNECSERMRHGRGGIDRNRNITSNDLRRSDYHIISK